MNTMHNRHAAARTKKYAHKIAAAGKRPQYLTKRIFLIMVYGRWGSEPYGTAKTLVMAKRKAKAASQKDTKNEYCVEIEPGGFENPLYKNGRQIGGAHIGRERDPQRRTTRDASGAPSSRRANTHRTRTFQSRMEAVEFANESLGPDYEVVGRMAGHLRLKKRSSGAVFVLNWPKNSRDPAMHNHRLATRRRASATRIRKIGKATRYEKRLTLSKDRYEVVSDQSGYVVGHVRATWVGSAENLAKKKFGKHVHVWAEGQRPKKVGDEGGLRIHRDPSKSPGQAVSSRKRTGRDMDLREMSIQALGRLLIKALRSGHDAMAHKIEKEIERRSKR